MTTVLEHIPENDPLAIPEQKAMIDQIIADNRATPGATMVILNELQNKIGHISTPMQAYVAQELKVPMGAVHGVVSFYSFFTTQPRGRHTIKFCMGTACYVGGTPQLIEKAKQSPAAGTDSVQEARELLLSGKLTSPENVRAAAESILDFGI